MTEYKPATWGAILRGLLRETPPLTEWVTTPFSTATESDGKSWWPWWKLWKHWK